MGYQALGLVETRGFVAAVEAADAMCKAARVRFSRYEVTRDALVTVVVRGAVAEVDAAVAAGASAAARVGELVARHVIPAPEPQLERPIGGPRAAGRDGSGPGERAVP
ncbi:MAG TPA: BMC domain-containing protein [Candidatus Eisenbacteria bacterium]